MFKFGITSDVAKVSAAFDRMARGQVPFATSLALNRTAEIARDSLKAQLPHIFDRPKPYVVNSVFIKRATKSNLTARVFHSDRVSPYLQAEIEGGSRSEKRFELRLGDDVLVPTRNAPRDSYGGVSKAFITRVFSQAKPIGESRMDEYVLVPMGAQSKLSPGIYQRKGGQIRALFLFKVQTSYEPRYDMEGLVQNVVKITFGDQFAAAMDFALGTANIRL